MVYIVTICAKYDLYKTLLNDLPWMQLLIKNLLLLQAGFHVILVITNAKVLGRVYPTSNFVTMLRTVRKQTMKDKAFVSEVSLLYHLNLL